MGLANRAQLFIRLLLAAVAILAIWLLGSEDAYKDEMILRASLTLAVIALVPISFLIALVGAPYRTERDIRISAQTALTQLETKQDARALNEEEKGVLASAIRNSGIRPKSINVIYDSDPESKDFAADIGDAILMANIDCDVHHGPMYTGPPRDRGIKIIRYKSAVLRELANVLANQFKEFGYLTEQRDSDQEQIFIVVARKPE